jgi:hypothetical protein
MYGKWDDVGATGINCSIASEGEVSNKAIDPVAMKDLQQRFSAMLGRSVGRSVRTY